MSSVEDTIFKVAPQLRDNAQVSSGYVMIQCPYHGGGQERTPSCSISRTRPVFFCHGCKTSGHIRKLLRTLGANKVYAQTLTDAVGYSDNQTEYKSTGYFHKERNTYVHNPYRGLFLLDEEVLDPYMNTPVDLLRAGFDVDTVRFFEAGYDNSTCRITYPLRNVYGDLVGISGRTTIGEEPRYRIYKRDLIERRDVDIPSDYTIDSVKRVLLWNLHTVHKSINAQHELLVITEGFKACMWVWQNGYKNVVALIGSYMSKEQADLIASTATHVLLMLDGDEAGITGTNRAINRLHEAGVLSLLVAAYPEGTYQPDDLDEEEIETAVTTAQPPTVWKRQA